MTTLGGLSILATHSGFICGHCGKVATKAPPGRATGASVKAAILSQHRPASKLSIFKIRTAIALFYPTGICLSQPRAACPAMAYGRCCAVLIFNQPQACPAYFKGGVTTLKNRPHAGSLDCVEPVLNGEHATLPLSRHCQVVLGVVPHDCFAQANLPAPAVRWSETLS